MFNANLHQSGKLLRYALGELSVQDGESVTKHLATCERCREFVSFVMQFNESLRSVRSEMVVPNEPCPDPSLIVALETGNLDDTTASHVRAHMVFCEACLEEFFCLRRLAEGETWDLVEKVKESLIDLGVTYGAGTLRGLAQIVTETPSFALRSGEESSGTFKVLEVAMAENRYSMELRVAGDGSLSCDVAGFRTPIRVPLRLTLRTETGKAIASVSSDDFGNAQLTIPDNRLEGDVYVLSLALEDREQHLLIRLPES